MEQRHLLTLLSDFGLSDSYVGIMKGAIAQVNPALTVVDLTHQIPPQNIALARFAFMTAVPYFPHGTVHVAVVDPGVGSSRRAIALAIGEQATPPAAYLVGPDNGLFSGVFDTQPVLAAVELTNPRYWRTATPSATFHGRDIFAPVGAHLASGVPLSQLGQPIAPETLAVLNVPRFKMPQCRLYKGDRYEDDRYEDDRATPANASGNGDSGAIYDPVDTMTGCLQAIDHFGNLITNIPGACVVGQQWSLLVKGVTLAGGETYSDRPTGELVAIVGSHGWIEIAVNGASAQAKLQVSADALNSVPIELVLHRA